MVIGRLIFTMEVCFRANGLVIEIEGKEFKDHKEGEVGLWPEKDNKVTKESKEGTKRNMKKFEQIP